MDTLTAATMRSLLGLALIGIKASRVEAHGVDGDGHGPVESSAASRLAVSIIVPLSAETAAKMATVLEDAGAEQVAVSEATSSMSYAGSAYARQRKMPRIPALLPDSAADGRAGIRFEVDLAELERLELTWKLALRRSHDCAEVDQAVLLGGVQAAGAPQAGRARVARLPDLRQ
jgi:hypothetical protein